MNKVRKNSRKGDCSHWGPEPSSTSFHLTWFTWTVSYKKMEEGDGFDKLLLTRFREVVTLRLEGQVFLPIPWYTFVSLGTVNLSNLGQKIRSHIIVYLVVS